MGISIGLNQLMNEMRMADIGSHGLAMLLALEYKAGLRPDHKVVRTTLEEWRVLSAVHDRKQFAKTREKMKEVGVIKEQVDGKAILITLYPLWEAPQDIYAGSERGLSKGMSSGVSQGITLGESEGESAGIMEGELIGIMEGKSEGVSRGLSMGQTVGGDDRGREVDKPSPARRIIEQLREKQERSLPHCKGFAVEKQRIQRSL